MIADDDWLTQGHADDIIFSHFDGLLLVDKRRYDILTSDQLVPLTDSLNNTPVTCLIRPLAFPLHEGLHNKRHLSEGCLSLIQSHMSTLAGDL